ncbi:MAG: cytochrome P450 [Caldilineaceae bacterium]|nr:cytochrome P450 [Caldilineaceae bacterium]
MESEIPPTINSLDPLLTSPDYFVDPYPVLARLRMEAPVYWSEAWGGWVLTRYADVVAVLRDPARFSSAGRITYLLAQLPAADRRRAALLERHYQVGLAHADPPDHTRLRTLLNRYFTPRHLESLRPRIAQLVESMLDQCQRADSMDVIHDLAYPLPAIVVLEMIGAPAEDRDLFRDWALGINRLFAAGGRTSLDAVDAALTSLAEIRAYISDLAAQRRRDPREDLISLLVHAGADEQLSEGELLATCVTLFVAGHETTTNLIGNGLLALLRHPEQLAQLRENPALSLPAMEELLRYDTPVPRGWRLAKADMEIGGQTIRAGDLLLPMIGAANRDPAQFPHPDRLDFGRADNRHVGFGYGIHFCLGAPLARLEVPAALNALLRRFPALRLDESSPLIWRRDVALRGIDSLPVLL